MITVAFILAGKQINIFLEQDDYMLLIIVPWYQKENIIHLYDRNPHKSQ
jgi:hypothetical protein